nr:MAG TPA: TraM Transcriptional activator TraM [Caudoviricetes sp.]
MNPPDETVGKTIPSMRLLDADELAAAVLTQSGLKIEADDPAMTDMLIQQAVLAAVFANFQTALAQQHEQAAADFQAAFAESAAPVLDAAKQIERKKQQMVAEILQANSADRAAGQTELHRSVSQQAVKQAQRHLDGFTGSLKSLLWKAVILLVVVQMLVLSVVAWVSGK